MSKLSHTARERKRVRLTEFTQLLKNLPDDMEVLKRTKYQFSLRVLDGPYVQVYPTTLKVVSDDDGTVLNAITVAGLLLLVRRLSQPGAPTNA